METLSSDERTIVDAAERLLTKFLEPAEATGMCYRMTFFLHLYLVEKGIETSPIVGYINDGSDEIMVSHAWLEYRGKKVDLTLGNSENPDLNPIGEIIVLDHPVRSGHIYSYHREKSTAAAEFEAQGLQNPRVAWLVRHKQVEHLAMSARAINAADMRVYLDAAPDGITFERLTAIIEPDRSSSEHQYPSGGV